MTRGLLFAAILATVLDAGAYIVWISSGAVREINPLIAAASIWLALAAKGALLVLLVAFTSFAPARYGRAVLLVAVAVGCVGVVSTVGSVG